MLDFWVLIQNTIINLNNIEKNILEFDEILNWIKPILNNIKKVINISNKILNLAQDPLKKVENNTKYINKKINYLNNISFEKQKLLNKILQYNNILIKNIKKFVDNIKMNIINKKVKILKDIKIKKIWTKNIDKLNKNINNFSNKVNSSKNKIQNTLKIEKYKNDFFIKNFP